MGVWGYPWQNATASLKLCDPSLKRAWVNGYPWQNATASLKRRHLAISTIPSARYPWQNATASLKPLSELPAATLKPRLSVAKRHGLIEAATRHPQTPGPSSVIRGKTPRPH